MRDLEQHGIDTIDRDELKELGIATPGGCIIHSGIVLCRPIDGWLETAKLIDAKRRLAAS